MIAYDQGDRLTSLTPPGGTATTYGFDALGRTSSATTSGTTTGYAFIGASEVVWSRQVGAGPAVQALLDGAGERLALKAATTLAWLVPDLHGNVVAAYSADEATVTNALRYDAYGTTLGTYDSGAGVVSAWKYQGRLDVSPDTTNPLYDAGARFYNPALGAFTQLDSLLGSASAPLSLNRYLYAAANPATLVDPDGHTYFCPGHTRLECSVDANGATDAPFQTSKGLCGVKVSCTTPYRGDETRNEAYALGRAQHRALSHGTALVGNSSFGLTNGAKAEDWAKSADPLQTQFNEIKADCDAGGEAACKVIHQPGGYWGLSNFERDPVSGLVFLGGGLACVYACFTAAGAVTVTAEESIAGGVTAAQVAGLAKLAIAGGAFGSSANALAYGLANGETSTPQGYLGAAANGFAVGSVGAVSPIIGGTGIGGLAVTGGLDFGAGVAGTAAQGLIAEGKLPSDAQLVSGGAIAMGSAQVTAAMFPMRGLTSVGQVPFFAPRTLSGLLGGSYNGRQLIYQAYGNGVLGQLAEFLLMGR